MWQVLYEELKDEGFELIAVALDTGGRAAVEPSIRCEDLAERPAAMAPLMGWSQELWRRMAPPQYLCLIDEEHILADIYGFVNVPMGVWIDEEGRIVRPAEPAGASDNFRHMDQTTFEIPQDEVQRLARNREIYWDALRDWVRKGHASEFALSPEEVRRKQRGRSEEDVRAAAHARIGSHLFARGDHEAAKAHFRAAVRLAPDHWNYRRQSMVLEPDLIGELNTAPEFYEAVAALGNRGYYDAVDIPGIEQDPLVVAAAAGADPPTDEARHGPEGGSRSSEAKHNSNERLFDNLRESCLDRAMRRDLRDGK